MDLLEPQNDALVVGIQATPIASRVPSRSLHMSGTLCIVLHTILSPPVCTSTSERKRWVLASPNVICFSRREAATSFSNSSVNK